MPGTSRKKRAWTPAKDTTRADVLGAVRDLAYRDETGRMIWPTTPEVAMRVEATEAETQSHLEQLVETRVLDHVVRQGRPIWRPHGRTG